MSSTFLWHVPHFRHFDEEKHILLGIGQRLRKERTKVWAFIWLSDNARHCYRLRDDRGELLFMTDMELAPRIMNKPGQIRLWDVITPVLQTSLFPKDSMRATTQLLKVMRMIQDTGEHGKSIRYDKFLAYEEVRRSSVFASTQDRDFQDLDIDAGKPNRHKSRQAGYPQDSYSELEDAIVTKQDMILGPPRVIARVLSDSDSTCVPTPKREPRDTISSLPNPADKVHAGSPSTDLYGSPPVPTPPSSLRAPEVVMHPIRSSQSTKYSEEESSKDLEEVMKGIGDIREKAEKADRLYYIHKQFVDAIRKLRDEYGELDGPLRHHIQETEGHMITTINEWMASVQKN